MINEATAILSKNGSDRKGKDKGEDEDSSLDISVVLHEVTGLLQYFPADQLFDSLTNGEICDSLNLDDPSLQVIVIL